ncbi:MAG: deoxyribodipyrimidine photo-lyase, partial [Flavobacteriaceae bacterium]
MKEKISVFWFRRDLRLDDNVGLFEALNGAFPVLPIFIFDKDILEGLPMEDPRVSFIHQNLQRLRTILQQQFSSSIAIFHGKPLEIFKGLTDKYAIDCVYTNHDYEPYAISRDNAVRTLLETSGISFKTFKDQVIFEKNEVVKEDGNPYVVYTPYKNKWKEHFNADKHLQLHDSMGNLRKLMPIANLPNLSLKELGFAPSKIKVPDYVITPT